MSILDFCGLDNEGGSYFPKTKQRRYGTKEHSEGLDAGCGFKLREDGVESRRLLNQLLLRIFGRGAVYVLGRNCHRNVTKFGVEE